jgi:hypothetical protein
LRAWTKGRDVPAESSGLSTSGIDSNKAGDVQSPSEQQNCAGEVGKQASKSSLRAGTRLEDVSWVAQVAVQLAGTGGTTEKRRSALIMGTGHLWKRQPREQPAHVPLQSRPIML